MDKENRDSFVYYRDWYDMVKDEDDVSRLAMYDAITRYVFEDIEPENLIIKMAFKLIKAQIDRDKQKYADKVEKRKAAGRLGGKQRVANQANASNAKQNQANQADNVNVNVNGNVLQDTKVSMCNDKLTTMNSCLSDSKKSNAPKDIKFIVDYWNDSQKKHNANIKPIKSVRADGKKHKSIRARLNEYGIDAVKEVIDNAMKSNYLNGRKNGFLADADWIFLPNNFEKAYGGNYNDPEQKAPTPPLQPQLQNKPGVVQQAKNNTQAFEAWCAQNGRDPQDSQAGIDYFNYIKKNGN